MSASAAANGAFWRVFMVTAAGSVGVGAVPADPNPHRRLNVDVVLVAAFWATHVEKVGHS
jgi:hypothetical protein